MVEDNFAKAVTGAIAETRRQWQDFRAALTDRYGSASGAEAMPCSYTTRSGSSDVPSSCCVGHTLHGHLPRGGRVGHWRTAPWVRFAQADVYADLAQHDARCAQLRWAR